MNECRVNILIKGKGKAFESHIMMTAIAVNVN
jgi:hypothetical protein